MCAPLSEASSLVMVMVWPNGLGRFCHAVAATTTVNIQVLHIMLPVLRDCGDFWSHTHTHREPGKPNQ